MKYKLIAFALILTVTSWGQTANQTSTVLQAGKASPEKPACACCDKNKAEAAEGTTEAKVVHSCCAHHDMTGQDGKEPMSCARMAKDKDAGMDMKDKVSCCNGKDGSSCNAGKGKTDAGCCGSQKCEKNGEKGCCDKKTETTAMNCCHSKNPAIDTSEKISK
ncbi:MAG: hypothetical protein ACLQLC_02915 [Candidatus Sulfotelmatobacter sp.]